MFTKLITTDPSAAKAAKAESQRVWADSLVASYDQFARQCKEKNFTPTVRLYTLWLECQAN